MMNFDKETANKIEKLARKLDYVQIMFRFNIPEEMRKEYEAIYTELKKLRGDI